MKVRRSLSGSLLFSLAALLAVFSTPCLGQQSYEELILADEPFAYWRLDETAAGSLTNLGTNSGETATYTGALEVGVPGLADPDNTAVRFFGFDEDLEVGGKVDIADSSFSNAGGPYAEKTIELWFSADDADTFDEQILYEQGGSTRGMVLFIREGEVFVGAHNSNNDDSGVSSPWPAGTGGERELAFVSTAIESNTPYHLALVMEGDEDGFEGSIKGYLNGELFGEVDGIGRIFAHTDDIAIGGVRAQTLFDNGLLGDDAPDLRFFQGVIDEVALYNRALTEGRIAIHFGDDISGDINGDGTVDLGDFLVLSSNFNGPGEFSDGDINFDTQVNMSDFVLWRNIFQGQAQGVAAVPEPSAGLLAIGSLLLLPYLRRRRFVRPTDTL